MLDLSTITALQIPEGNVTQIAIGENVIWTGVEKWDIEWNHEETLALPSSEWTIKKSSSSDVTVTNTQTSGVICNTIANANYTAYIAFRHDTYTSNLSRRAVLEVELQPQQVYWDQRGMRITLGEGVDGIASGRGLNVSIKQGYNESIDGQGIMRIHVYTGSTSLTDPDVQPKTAIVANNTWHKVRLELDTINNQNKVYLNGELLATVDNADLSTKSAGSWQVEIQKGRGCFRAIRYKNLES